MSEAVEDDGMRAVRTQWSASAFVYVLVWEGGREGEGGKGSHGAKEKREGEKEGKELDHAWRTRARGKMWWREPETCGREKDGMCVCA